MCIYEAFEEIIFHVIQLNPKPSGLYVIYLQVLGDYNPIIAIPVSP